MYQIYDGKNMNINQLSDRDDEEESRSFYLEENQINSEEKMNDDTQQLEFIPCDVEMKHQIYENPLNINSSEDSQSVNWSMFGDGKGKLAEGKQFILFICGVQGSCKEEIKARLRIFEQPVHNEFYYLLFFQFLLVNKYFTFENKQMLFNNVEKLETSFEIYFTTNFKKNILFLIKNKILLMMHHDLRFH